MRSVQGRVCSATCSLRPSLPGRVNRFGGPSVCRTGHLFFRMRTRSGEKPLRELLQFDRLGEDDSLTSPAGQVKPSEGTFTVSTYKSINADFMFTVCRDGEEVDDFGESGGGEVRSPEARRALEEMGADDVLEIAFDRDIELLCRIAGIRPTVADVSGPARITIINGF